MIQIGVDIGGTFTDVVAYDHEAQRLYTHKVLTTKERPARAVLQALRDLFGEGDTSLRKVERIVHGTTLVTNAIIERKGARTGLITTKGFRDILEFRRETRQDLYDLTIEAPDPLIPRQWRLEADERILANGSVYKELDGDELVNVLTILRDSGVTSIAICLLHSFRNPVHEKRIRKVAQEVCPNVFLSLSSEVAPTIREYERTSTTVLNAYTQIILRSYLKELLNQFAEQGFHGRFLVMLSDGGIAPASTSEKFPVRLLESGPAAGMAAAARTSQARGLQETIGFDMGGTTAKICLIRDAKPDIRTSFEVARNYRHKPGSGYPVELPMVDMIEIGAGGGSIARINHLGLIQVGPESVGSSPGPTCYGLGGKEPTVTDADLILGYLNAERFLGGRMLLDISAAHDVIQHKIADPMDLDVLRAAWAIHETVNEDMVLAMKIHLAEKGVDYRSFSLIAFGGAGPVHACALARKLRLNHVVIPQDAGVASAFGLITSPQSLEVAHTFEMNLDSVSATAVNALLQDLENQACGLLHLSATERRQATIQVQADMRYVGQTHIITVNLPKHSLPEDSSEYLRSVFEEAYEMQFGRLQEVNINVEIINWRLTVFLPPVFRYRPTLVLRNQPESAFRPQGSREVMFAAASTPQACPIYFRYDLPVGERIDGPAVIEEEGSTTVVDPLSSVSVDDQGNLMIQLEYA